MSAPTLAPAPAILEVPRETFGNALHQARLIWQKCKDSTSKPEEMSLTARYYLTEDGQSGFGVTTDGELIGVFSLERGRGDQLVAAAILMGARRLDCFDGYLPKLYARHGFSEYDRKPNWTPGGPDVVWMTLDGTR